MPPKLGQHFLTDTSTLQKIAAALQVQPGDTIIEIGPGHGELTQKIIEAAQGIPKVQIILIERDPELAGAIKKFFSTIPTVRVIQGDALKLLQPLVKNLKLTHKKNYKVVGNIPYYITGKLLRILSELSVLPGRVVLTIQHEVALRLTARPPAMNLLAAAVQFWAEPKIIGRLPREAFSPPPNVESAIILLAPHKTKLAGRETYYRLIHLAFKQPRKTLLNNLRAGNIFSKNQVMDALKTAQIPLESRPQNLNIEKIKALSRQLLP